MAGHKTKKIHDSEHVIQLQFDIKCNKNTNMQVVFDKLKRTINADWDCILMNDNIKMIDKTKEHKEKQEANTPQ